MQDEDSGWVEADITINGQTLTFGQSMALRVAVSSFRMSLISEAMQNGLGEIAAGYDAQLLAVERALFKAKG